MAVRSIFYVNLQILLNFEISLQCCQADWPGDGRTVLIRALDYYADKVILAFVAYSLQ